MPIGTSFRLMQPELSVFPVILKPVAVLVATTGAPGTTAPEVSVMVPVMVPVIIRWADADWGRARRKHAINNRRSEVLRSSIFIEIAYFSQVWDEGTRKPV